MKKKDIKYKNATYKIEQEEPNKETKNKQNYNVELKLKFKASKKNYGIPVVYIAGFAVFLIILILIIK